MSAIVAFFAVIGVIHVAAFLAFVGLIAWQERGKARAARNRVSAWDGDDVPVVGRGGWL